MHGFRRKTIFSAKHSHKDKSFSNKSSLLCSQRFSTDVPCSTYYKADGTEPDELYKTINIEVKGHDTAVLNSYETFVKMAAKELEVTISKIWSPPKVVRRYTLLKSVHVYRKHMVQYEARTHFRCFEDAYCAAEHKEEESCRAPRKLQHLTGSTANTLLEYIQRNLPEGMAMKVTRHAIEALPDYIQSPPVSQAASRQ